MRVKRRELVLLFLPCFALLLWASMVGRTRPQSKSFLTVNCNVEALRPEPTWEETDTRVRTAMKTADEGVAAQLQAYQHYFTSSGHTYRWYYNSRIEGLYRGRKQIFYSSTEFNNWKCWCASSNSINWNKHELRERFSLRRLPAGVTNLTYRVEIVAFKSTWTAGEAVGQKQIQQMRQWKNAVGYASQTVPLKHQDV